MTLQTSRSVPSTGVGREAPEERPSSRAPMAGEGAKGRTRPKVDNFAAPRRADTSRTDAAWWRMWANDGRIALFSPEGFVTDDRTMLSTARGILLVRLIPAGPS